jgi:hypothetical protein
MENVVTSSLPRASPAGGQSSNPRLVGELVAGGPTPAFIAFRAAPAVRRRPHAAWLAAAGSGPYPGRGVLAPGQAKGLEYRIKGESSLAGKLRDRAAENPLSALALGKAVEQEAAQISDTLRYTIILEPDATHGTAGTPSTGFEVQLHADESFATKQKNHNETEQNRAPGTTEQRRQVLSETMEDRWRDVAIAAGLRSVVASVDLQDNTFVPTRRRR